MAIVRGCVQGSQIVFWDSGRCVNGVGCMKEGGSVEVTMTLQPGSQCPETWLATVGCIGDEPAVWLDVGEGCCPKDCWARSDFVRVTLSYGDLCNADPCPECSNVQESFMLERNPQDPNGCTWQYAGPGPRAGSSMVIGYGGSLQFNTTWVSVDYAAGPCSVSLTSGNVEGTLKTGKFELGHRCGPEFQMWCGAEPHGTCYCGFDANVEFVG